MKDSRSIAYRLPILASMLVLTALLAMSEIALGASPYLAYAYPAGGQKGSTFEVTIGGQSLKGTTVAEVTGGGVKVSIVRYIGSGGAIGVTQEDAFRALIDYLINKASGKNPKPLAPSSLKLPDVPDLRNLDRKSLDELKEIKDKYLNRSRRPVAPMAEEVTLKVTIDPGADTGDRQLRLRTSSGYSNPLVFQVSSMKEIKEVDAALDKANNRVFPTVSRAPIVLNGQIMPGDVDKFPLQLQAGQKVMAVAYARALIPYLADAVPGWFQAVLAAYDSEGNELAYVDDCGYDPDPVLTFEAPKAGTYYLEIRDSIYRGRRDFVYRIAVGDPDRPQTLLTTGNRGGVHFYGAAGKAATPVDNAPFETWSALQVVSESESNDSAQQAPVVSLPQVVRGSIAKAGDIDYYQFSGKAGDEIVAEVLARRAGSPLDSLLRLMDSTGKVLAWNDDTQDRGSGLITHQADSYIKYRLPETGTYVLQISDAQSHGSADHTYSLRVSQPMPDFTLWVSPSSVNIETGKTAVITVDVLRADGWNGEIQMSLKDAPEGYVLGGATIPPGRNQIRMTLTTSLTGINNLQLEGRATIGGQTVVRPVKFADKLMQAFAIYHIAPSQEGTIAVTRSSRSTLSMSLSSTIRIPSAGKAEVLCLLNPMPTGPVRLELREAPAGITLKETKAHPNGIVLVLAADDKHTGYADNLIVEAFTETETPGVNGAAPVKKKTSLGLLPAIPIEIVP